MEVGTLQTLSSLSVMVKTNFEIVKTFINGESKLQARPSREVHAGAVDLPVDEIF